MQERFKDIRSLMFCGLILGVLGACAPEEGGVSSIETGELVITAIGPTEILPYTELEIQGSGFLSPEAGAQTLWVTNPLGLNVLLETQFVDANTIRAPLGEALSASIQPGIDLGICNLRLSRTSNVSGEISTFDTSLGLTFQTQLSPTFIGIQGGTWYPGDRVSISGSNFLRAEEGDLVGLFTGTISAGAPQVDQPYENFPVFLVPNSRGQAFLELQPDVFGILPAEIIGQLRIENRPLGGTTASSTTLPIGPINFERPYLQSASPLVIRRGQTLWLRGRGFLPTNPLLQASSLVLLEGVLETTRGELVSYEDDHVLPLFPDIFYENTEMGYTLRITQTVDGTFEGLGLSAGTFRGTATPWLLSGVDTVLGSALPIELVIAPQLQVVYLKYLPGFYDALEQMGLLNVSDAIQAHILQLVHRDYLGINIAFTESIPEDFAEFSTVEIGGEDPNGASLFGLDNTDGKDVGNLRFNDIIGGVNAETAEEGYYAYGGIFVASFLEMSPTLGKGTLPITDARFDVIFGPFTPGLGGTPATPQELNGGPRSAALYEAIRVLGNLVGNTVTHEVGHSLGLTSIDGQFHNVGDNEGWIMDAGIHRPFAERAEIDGAGPAVFSPFNRAYLEAVLPVK